MCIEVRGQMKEACPSHDEPTNSLLERWGIQLVAKSWVGINSELEMNQLVLSFSVYRGSFLLMILATSC